MFTGYTGAVPTGTSSMRSFDSDNRKSSKAFLALVLLVIVAGIAFGGYYFAPRFERQAPQITLTPAAGLLGMAPVEIGIADAGSGLKALSATLSAGGTEHTLADERYAEPLNEKRISFAAAKLAGIKEGPAVLRVTARDGSLWNFFRGNETVLQKELTIDITPPSIELVADDRYISHGGAGAIVYKASADTAVSGVKVGDYFFAGVSGQIKGQPDRFVAFFAHPYNVPAGGRTLLVATDKAGNTRETPLVYELKGVRYRKSTIALSDAFLQRKVAALAGQAEAGPKEMFIAVNRRLRKENEDKIAAVTRKVTPAMLWSGAFVQLSNSKVEANFADERTYTYKGEAIDTAFHVGYDLSVTKHYPVEAANGGTVAFAGDLGIYGGTVILDHGLGLFTLYSHLSAIDVKEGDPVKQRQALGRTGETGLAAGDHLHYGVYLHGVPVLPVEWWDPKWIADNIQPKLEGLSGEAIAQAQEAAKAPRKRRR